jgi:group I intron endonuclease
MTTSFIYGLVDPRTDKIRYIGKTKAGMKRPQSHGLVCHLKKDRTHKARWIQELRRAGLSYSVVVLEEVFEQDLCQAERRWIASARAQGWPLTNLTDGGDGLGGHKFSSEHRAKISAANKGRKHTEEQRRKFMEHVRTRKHPYENTCKAHLSRVGSKHTEKTKARIGAAHLGKVVSAESRAKVSAANSRPVTDVSTGVTYPSATAAAKHLGLCYRSVVQVLNGHKYTTGGRVFVKAYLLS